MQLQLLRQYDPKAINGTLFCNEEQICHTIELPWKNNAPRISCIPEGTYTLVERYSPKFHRHLHLTDVKERSNILIHPANNAVRELKGCIAPVMLLTGPGTGVRSREAMQKLFACINEQLQQHNYITLNISACPEHCFKNNETSDR
jgi:hypothetical protein